MKKIFIAFLSVLFLAGCSDNTQNTNNQSAFNVARVSTNSQMYNNEMAPQIMNNSAEPQIVNIGAFDNANYMNVTSQKTNEPQEVEIANFTTDILTDDNKRENNIDITCSKINNYVVKAGETFSFTETVGKATEEKGYEKADIFDANGNKAKGLGGGNCQVSSTLYNAVLQAEGDFEIVERHEHSSKVYYVPDGMDATVAYGSLDFKFKNNNNFDIKIYASTDTETVNVRLVKIAY